MVLARNVIASLFPDCMRVLVQQDTVSIFPIKPQFQCILQGVSDHLIKEKRQIIGIHPGRMNIVSYVELSPINPKEDVKIIRNSCPVFMTHRCTETIIIAPVKYFFFAI